MQENTPLVLVLQGVNPTGFEQENRYYDGQRLNCAFLGRQRHEFYWRRLTGTSTRPWYVDAKRLPQTAGVGYDRLEGVLVGSRLTDTVYTRMGAYVVYHLRGRTGAALLIAVPSDFDPDNPVPPPRKPGERRMHTHIVLLAVSPEQHFGPDDKCVRGLLEVLNVGPQEE